MDWSLATKGKARRGLKPIEKLLTPRPKIKGQGEKKGGFLRNQPSGSAGYGGGKLQERVQGLKKRR